MLSDIWRNHCLYDSGVVLAWLVLDGIGIDLLGLAILILLGIPLAAGYIGAVVMERKGKSTRLGFFIGVALAVLGVTVYLAISWQVNASPTPTT